MRPCVGTSGRCPRCNTFRYPEAFCDEDIVTKDRMSCTIAHRTASLPAPSPPTYQESSCAPPLRTTKDNKFSRMQPCHQTLLRSLRYSTYSVSHHCRRSSATTSLRAGYRSSSTGSYFEYKKQSPQDPTLRRTCKHCGFIDCECPLKVAVHGSHLCESEPRRSDDNRVSYACRRETVVAPKVGTRNLVNRMAIL